MKHHIEAVISVPVCGLGGTSLIYEELLPGCFGDDDYGGDPCCSYSPIRERDGMKVIGGRCVCLDFLEKHIAFDCTAYEYDEVEGFKSRGRHYESGDILSLKIDGKIIEKTITDNPT